VYQKRQGLTLTCDRNYKKKEKERQGTILDEETIKLICFYIRNGLK
jgi:hypothetical protein